MPFPPYSGQGTALPDGGPYEGEWAIQDEVFLVRSPDIGDALVGFDLGDDETADGFGAAYLARGMGISTEALFAYNRAHQPPVEYTLIPTAPGADVTIRYTVQTPDHGVRFEMSRAKIRGRA